MKPFLPKSMLNQVLLLHAHLGHVLPSTIKAVVRTGLCACIPTTGIAMQLHTGSCSVCTQVKDRNPTLYPLHMRSIVETGASRSRLVRMNETNGYYEMHFSVITGMTRALLRTSSLSDKHWPYYCAACHLSQQLSAFQRAR